MTKEDAAVNFVCRDCGADVLHEFEYIVSDESWAATGLGPYDGLLCIGCIEGRLGRGLAPEDFDRRIPANAHSCFDSARLLSRKLGIEEEAADELRGWLAR